MAKSTTHQYEHVVYSFNQTYQAFCYNHSSAPMYSARLETAKHARRSGAPATLMLELTQLMEGGLLAVSLGFGLPTHGVDASCLQ
jgi:hypothetical protein